MNKKLFNLMVTAVVFTTNPLFAMDPSDEDPAHKTSLSLQKPNENEKESSIHECSSCTSSLLFENVKEDEGKGDFSILPDDECIGFMETLPLQGIASVMLTSKKMYNLCQNPLVWVSIAEREAFGVNQQSCIKEQFKNHYLYYLNLFSEWESKTDPKNGAEYTITNRQLKYFLKEPCSPTWYPYPSEEYNSDRFSFHFSIGKRQFELYISNKKHLEKIKNSSDSSKRHFYTYYFGGARGTSEYLSGPNGGFAACMGELCIIELKPKLEKSEEKQP